MSTTAGALELREVPEPGAFGSTPRKFWDLLRLIVLSDFRSQYANTALGFLWTIVRPLVFFGIIFLVLRQVLGVGEGIANYGPLLVLNLIIFTYFQEATTRSVRSLAAKGAFVRKMQFPRIIVPLSSALASAITMLLSLVAVLPLLLAFGLRPDASWLLFPLVIAGVFLITTAMTLILSVLQIRYEDTSQAWGLISRMLFYLTPVLFAIELVPEPWRKLVAINPLSLMLEQSRVWVVDPTAPTAIDAAGPIFGVVIPLLITGVLACLSIWLFVREAPRLAEGL